MALNKTPIDINFAKGLDLKSDPFQLAPGTFLSLTNTQFTKVGQLTKRNGFQQLASLPVTNTVTATTLGGNLVAIGTNLNILSQDTNQWYSKGAIQPLSLSVSPQVRTSTSQLTCDAAVASNGLLCTVWYDSNTNSYYRITDSNTGEVIVDTTQLTATVSATVGPKVFALGNYFVILYWQTITGTPTLRYLPISTSAPQTASPPLSLVAGASITAPISGTIMPNGSLYISFAAASSTLKTLYITQQLVTSAVKTISSVVVTDISVTPDSTNSIIYITYLVGSALTLVSYDINLNPILTGTSIGTSLGTVQNVTSSYANGVVTIFYETYAQYSYYASLPANSTPNGQSDFVSTITYTVATTTVSSPAVLLRSVGLASKAFYLSSTGNTYVLLTYAGLMQPTYFLADSSGNIVCKLAQSNGGGYYPTTNMPQVNINGNQVQIAYLYKDLLASVNKTTPATTGSQIAGIYNQTGINLASFTFTTNGSETAELAGSLQVTGGFMWQYDGAKPVEHNFHLFPEDLQATWSATGGAVVAKPDGTTNTNAYWYQATYEWTDAQGLLHRSAPSVPISVTTTGSGTAGSITVNIPTLRLTYKVSPNPVRIVLYRWSVANEVYYQVTSITAPQTNSTSTDSIAYVDTLADASIIGNTILYTNGGVVENIAAPAITDLCPFNTRLFAIDAEDQNLLWYSKQVIENTPVEMSDLFTLYVAPTISAIGATGPMKCLFAMDDKLIIFKKDAIYYVTGIGPDNTGASNDFSNPTFITSTVGCANKASIVFMPNGLMFQSDKGIWLLGRDLNTTYIGAPVENFNSYTVVSANNIPGTNQVRFRLSNGTALVYDYYFGQWSTFVGVNGISSTIYQSLETIITAPITVSPPNSSAYQIAPQVYQETPGVYLDGTNPVLMSLQTGWMNLAGIQGYERLYQVLFLGNYLSPFTLNVQFAFDYISSIQQSVIVSPNAPGSVFGLAAGPMGSESPFGGNATPFKARVFPNIQKCESFQLTINEQYDPQYGTVAGAGLTLSGLQMLTGLKKVSRTQATGRSFG